MRAENVTLPAERRETEVRSTIAYGDSFGGFQALPIAGNANSLKALEAYPRPTGRRRPASFPAGSTVPTVKNPLHISFPKAFQPGPAIISYGQKMMGLAAGEKRAVALWGILQYG